MLVVVITGARDRDDPDLVARALHGAEALIVGDASGIDACALRIALTWGIIPNVYCADVTRAARLRALNRGINVFQVCDWRRVGKLAGGIRNAAMVSRARLERAGGMHVSCVAFPDVRSRGTWDCVERMHAAGFEVARL